MKRKHYVFVYLRLGAVILVDVLGYILSSGKYKAEPLKDAKKSLMDYYSTKEYSYEIESEIMTVNYSNGTVKTYRGNGVYWFDAELGYRLTQKEEAVLYDQYRELYLIPNCSI